MSPSVAYDGMAAADAVYQSAGQANSCAACSAWLLAEEDENKI